MSNPNLDEVDDDACGIDHSEDPPEDLDATRVDPVSFAPGLIGWKRVPAEKYKSGYERFQLRTDLADSYVAAHTEALALGGIISSSGARRWLDATVTPGRSKTSLHYTGRALDLYVATGMRGADDRYLVQREGGTDEHPRWHVYCVSIDEKPDAPEYDATLIKEGELEYAVWKKNVGYTTATRTVRYFSLTDLFARHGWTRIGSRVGWKTSYDKLEWWHFQNASGLVTGVSRFGDELEKVWSKNTVAHSGLAVNALWQDGAFIA